MLPARAVGSRNFRFPLFPLTLSFFAFLSFFSPPARAFENPQRYYDWAPPRRMAVLGIGAPEGTPSAAARLLEINRFRGYLFGLGENFNPESPFYFVKKFQENVALALASDAQRREGLRLAIAGERLAEMEDLAKANKVEVLRRVSEDYHRLLGTVAANLSQLRERRPGAVLNLDTFEGETNKHLLVLETVVLKAPEVAHEALELALAASAKVTDRVADLSGRPALPFEVRERLQALKAQGLLSPEEVQKLVAADSRVKVREELKKYAKEGVFPEADIAKLNEWAKEKLAEDHHQIVELKKLLELKRLEEEKPDPETLKKVQAFAQTYKPGDLIPPDLRRYWVPLIRLEELQNTLRPDWINPELLEAKKEYFEKFSEVVEKMKPRREDFERYEKLRAQNPSLDRDPFYGRLRGLAEKFGTVNEALPPTDVGRSCPSNAHWANIPFMPEGGYCVPNITYPPVEEITEGRREGEKAAAVCPEKYHRNYPGGPCLPDNYTGPVLFQPTYTPGGYPSPIYPPVRCPAGYFWSGTACLAKERKEGEKREEVEKCFRAGKYWYNEACHDKPEAGGLKEEEKKPEIEACFRAGKYWYEDQCHDRPQTIKDQFEEERTEMEACFKSGRFWYNDRCQDRPESGGGPPRGGGGGKEVPPTGYGQCPAGQSWNGFACVSPEPNVMPPPSPTPAPEPTSAPPPSPQPTSGTPPSGGESSGGSACPSGYYFKEGACVKGEY